MGLGELANLGEFLGGLAVIGSLIYVGYQIRQNTKSVRRASAREAAAQNVSALRTMIDYAEVFADPETFGFSTRSELDPAAQIRFDLGWAIWLQAAEQVFADVREGFLDEEYQEPYRTLLQGVLSLPGGVRFWAERRVWFSQSFQAEVDSLVKPSP